MLGGECPVVVGDAVRLLQLHLDEPAPEALQPCVRIALRAFGSGHALMADVEAEAPGDVLGVAIGEQVLDLRHGRRLAHRDQVLDEEILEPDRARVCGDRFEIALQPSQRSARRSGSVQSGTLIAPTWPPVARAPSAAVRSMMLRYHCTAASRRPWSGCMSRSSE